VLEVLLELDLRANRPTPGKNPGFFDLTSSLPFLDTGTNLPFVFIPEPLVGLLSSTSSSDITVVAFFSSTGVGSDLAGSTFFSSIGASHLLIGSSSTT
jgi:hypothetical protein